MIEKERNRLLRTQDRTFIRKPFRYASVMDRIALLKLSLRGWEMDRDASYERYKELFRNP